MNSTIQEGEITNIPYFPRLMQSTDTGNVILFKCSGEGCIVASGSLERIGDIMYNCDMRKYKDFTGAIRLTNTYAK